MIKEIESNGYTRRQLYNCLNDNKDNIKKYMDEKNILEEYSKLKYIDTVIRAKIKDSSEYTQLKISNDINSDDIIYETDEEVIQRIDEQNKKNMNNIGILSILNKINNMKGDK